MHAKRAILNVHRFKFFGTIGFGFGTMGFGTMGFGFGLYGQLLQVSKDLGNSFAGCII
jgi:hypothetical protein